MTVNAQTPAELLAEAWAHIEHVVDSLPGSMREPTARGEGADERLALLVRVAGALEAMTAERVALDAVIEQVREQTEVGEDETLGKWAYRSRLMVIHRDILRAAPATVLAQRDAQVAADAVVDFACRAKVDHLDRYGVVLPDAHEVFVAAAAYADQVIADAAR